MHDGFAISLAWPETRCKQAGAWYDSVMNLIGINRSGYYKVGHAALILIDKTKGSCHYFDFGRYHSPHGKGRVRNASTDHDLKIITRPVFDLKKNSLLNTLEILHEIKENKSCHGEGELLAAVCKVSFKNAFQEALMLQTKEFIDYGPFVKGGTNCSRFVSSVIRAGKPNIPLRLLLKYPAMFTPTPFWNVLVTGKIRNIYRISDSKNLSCKRELKSELYEENCITIHP